MDGWINNGTRRKRAQRVSLRSLVSWRLRWDWELGVQHLSDGWKDERAFALKCSGVSLLSKLFFKLSMISAEGSPKPSPPKRPPDFFSIIITYIHSFFLSYLIHSTIIDKLQCETLWKTLCICVKNFFQCVNYIRQFPLWVAVRLYFYKERDTEAWVSLLVLSVYL